MQKKRRKKVSLHRIMENFRNTIKAFLAGALDKAVLQMILIFILAGAFAGMARGMGSVDATVNATLRLLPGSMIYAGLFFTACIISFSIGTSMGTIAAVVPLACGIAQQTGIHVPFVVGIVVGGAFFGDNLSFISDTTLAATRAMKVKMSDKFKANIKMAIPAVLLCLAVYITAGLKADISMPVTEDVDLAMLIPYIVVIILALCSVEVTTILAIGIVCCVITGLATHHSGIYAMLNSAWTGICGMTEVIIVALLAGGILAVIKSLGWFEIFTRWMERRVQSKRGAMGCIAALVSGTNIMTANNTVAILSIGGIAHDIAVNYKLNRRQTAGIIDVFSCLTQSFLPYGAQLLMASAFAGITSVEIIPWLFYPMALGIFAVAAILRIKSDESKTRQG